MKNYIKDSAGFLKDLALREVFALLVAETENGDIILRPIGGRYGSGIIEAIEEMKENFPGCRMKLFEVDYSNYNRYSRGIN